MPFNGNQPRIMHFGRVKIGDHYSVSPEATLGPTQKRESRASREITRVKTSREGTREREQKRLRAEKCEQRRRESTVREFENSSSTVV
jgi:hypothetical protein